MGVIRKMWGMGMYIFISSPVSGYGMEYTRDAGDADIYIYIYICPL